MPAPTYLPEAVPTTNGWAHPLTGEQLDCTKGLADPVAYYKPNAGGASFIDPEAGPTALIFSQKLGARKVKFAVHSRAPIESVEWVFELGGDAVVGESVISHVYGAAGTYAVSATVTFADETPEQILPLEVIV